jgi:hypothetical protein
MGTNNPNMEETGSLENPIPSGKCYLELNRARFWLLELRESQHFSTFYGPSVQAMETQLGAQHRPQTPTIH